MSRKFRKEINHHKTVINTSKISDVSFQALIHFNDEIDTSKLKEKKIFSQGAQAFGRMYVWRPDHLDLNFYDLSIKLKRDLER